MRSLLFHFPSFFQSLFSYSVSFVFSLPAFVYRSLSQRGQARRGTFCRVTTRTINVINPKISSPSRYFLSSDCQRWEELVGRGKSRIFHDFIERLVIVSFRSRYPSASPPNFNLSLAEEWCHPPVDHRHWFATTWITRFPSPRFFSIQTLSSRSSAAVHLRATLHTLIIVGPFSNCQSLSIVLRFLRFPRLLARGTIKPFA